MHLNPPLPPSPVLMHIQAPSSSQLHVALSPLASSSGSRSFTATTLLIPLAPSYGPIWPPVSLRSLPFKPPGSGKGRRVLPAYAFGLEVCANVCGVAYGGGASVHACVYTNIVTCDVFVVVDID